MADRQYELVYILPPDSTEQQVAEVHEQIGAVVARLNGQIERTDNWGRRRLCSLPFRDRPPHFIIHCPMSHCLSWLRW